ncbi:uncharacterized protein LOC124892340 [Capsicum annuum]|uniref:uncharacterized protein LOC124892340 n=1 Tax=Capsicum annuum TaxID=4072 RepID=UPI0007BEE2F0|nr:uncharacterized protein LOC124892340 [Capsicum annuum]
MKLGATQPVTTVNAIQQTAGWCEGMPKYAAKHLKDVIINKVKLQDIETVALTEECNSVVMQKMPKKLKDPGSFTLPIQIAVKWSTRLLADRSLARPEGIIEDILIKVGKFIIPADFIVLDFQADEKVPVILRWEEL